MKIKNKVIATVLGVLASSLFFIVAPTTANAGDCSAADPCGTWAVLDSSDRVVNLIMCQPSVCGSGTFGTQRVVLQVQANPVTNTTDGVGYISRETNNEVIYNDQEKTFNHGESSFPAPETKTEIVDTNTVLSVSLWTDLDGFRHDTFTDGWGVIQFSPITLTFDNAIISATKDSVTESRYFDEPKTRAEVAESVENNSIMLKTHLNRFFALLNKWLID